MTLVIDASIAAAWFLPDEQTASSDRLMDDLRVNPGVVPSLFWFETRNIFLVAGRRGRLAVGEAGLSMSQLRSLPLQDVGIGDDTLILALARRHGLPGYDASYLSVCVELAVPLATSDRKLIAAARVEELLSTIYFEIGIGYCKICARALYPAGGGIYYPSSTAHCARARSFSVSLLS